MFLSLLEMAELQGCSEDTVGIESGTVVCETLADQTLADCIESGEPDIQTLKNEIKSLVRNNQRLIRKTTKVVKLLHQITNKAEPPFENSRECNICFEEYSHERLDSEILFFRQKIFPVNLSNFDETEIFRKRMAFVPCGHSPSCLECFKNCVWNLGKACPICRREIRQAVALKGIY